MNWLDSLSLLASSSYFIIGLSTIVFLVLLKIYCSGAVCKVSRDLSEQIIVITGANSGIGKQTIRQLSKQSCTIFFGARDSRKSEETIKEIQKQNKNAKIVYFPLDLADKQSIRQFSTKINEQVNHIDILINNAGVMAIPQREITVDGFQTQIGINHFGHFYLTHLLWQIIKKSKEFRIINISSNAHKGIIFLKPQVKIDFEDISFKNGYNHVQAYGRSKAANILFTKQLQKKIDQSSLNGIAVSLRPGSVRTQITRHLSWRFAFFQYILHPILLLVMKSPWQGAQTTLYLTLQQISKIVKGGYYSDCKIISTSSFANNPQNAQRLWKLSQKLLEIQFII